MSALPAAAVLTSGLSQGVVTLLLCALAATLLLSSASRGRAVVLGILAIMTPAALLLRLLGQHSVNAVTSRPLLAIVGIVAAATCIVAVAVGMSRWRWLIPAMVVCALPLRFPLPVGSSSSNLLVALYLALAAGGIVLALDDARTSERFSLRQRGWLERLLALVLLFYGLQALYSLDAGKALEQAAFFYVPFSLLFVLLRDGEFSSKARTAAVTALVSLGLVFSAVGLWEYATRQLLLNPKVINSNGFEPYFRVNSLFFDPNMYGRFMVVAILVAVGVGLATKGKGRFATLTAITVVFWAGLLASLSQSSLAALLVGLSVLAAIRFSLRLSVAVGAGFGILGLTLIVLFPAALGLSKGTDAWDRVTSGRVALIAGGMHLAEQRPLTGWGSGSFSRAYRLNQESSKARAVSASHTIPITIAAEQGLIGLALYCALLGFTFFWLGRNARKCPPVAVLLAAFSALVLHTWSYAAFLEDPMVWFLWGTSIALVRAEKARHERPRSTPATSAHLTPQGMPV